MMTIKEAMSRAGLRLKKAGAQAPALDAAVLLGFITGLDHTGLYRERQRILTPEEEGRLDNFLTRRADGEPVAYLTGRKEFMGLEFTVNPSVLIPRPETELLVERAISLLKDYSRNVTQHSERSEDFTDCHSERGEESLPPFFRNNEKSNIIFPGCLIVDVGTGSGAIAVSLAVNLPQALIYATDISPEALQVARENTAKHSMEDRIIFRQGDLLSPLTEMGLAGQVDFIAANLPYVATEEMEILPRDVRDYEPPVALYSGANGLALYRRLIPEAASLLKPGGYLLLEIGYGQRAGITAMLPQPDWAVSIEQDLAGLDRLAVANRTSPES